jgi:Asp-tRNA(Asn)/Glu-tRNA(Gln) amidotransferase A subunit family amidase
MVISAAAPSNLERNTVGIRPPLHGISIPLKNSIVAPLEDGSADAGSCALLGSNTGEGTVIAKLKAVGAVHFSRILRTISEGFRSTA